MYCVSGITLNLSLQPAFIENGSTTYDEEISKHLGHGLRTGSTSVCYTDNEPLEVIIQF